MLLLLNEIGVESAEPDLKASQVTVKGVFEPPKLIDYVYKRTGKHAIIVKQEPEKKEDVDDKPKDDKKAQDNDNKDKDGKKADAAADGAAADGKDKKEEAGGEEAAKPETAAGGGEQEETKMLMELKKNEFYYYHPQNYQIYPPRFATEMYSSYPPAPQMFSDENPNACTVM